MHRRVEVGVRHRVLAAERCRMEGFDAGAHRIGLVGGRRMDSDCEVERHTGLEERRTVVAEGMGYAKVRHMEAAETDSLGAAAVGSLGAAVEGIVPAADNLEEGRRSHVVAGNTLEEDTGLAEVVGSPLEDVSEITECKEAAGWILRGGPP